MYNSSHHSFDINIAAEYGIEEAIIIHHFQHWIGINARANRNFHEGRFWTYQTYAQIAENFPYLNERKIKYAIRCLVEKKVLITGNFNKSKFDKTVWYAFENQKMFTKDNFVRPTEKIVQPIPDTKPDAQTNTCFVSADADAEKASHKEKNFDIETIKSICKSKYPKASDAEIDYAIEQLVKASKVSDPTKYVLAVLAKQFSSKVNKKANSLYEKCKEFFSGIERIETNFSTFLTRIEFKKLIFQASDSKREFCFSASDFKEAVHYFLYNYDLSLASRFQEAFPGGDYNVSNFMEKNKIKPWLVK